MSRRARRVNVTGLRTMGAASRIEGAERGLTHAKTRLRIALAHTDPLGRKTAPRQPVDRARIPAASLRAVERLLSVGAW